MKAGVRATKRVCWLCWLTILFASPTVRIFLFLSLLFFVLVPAFGFAPCLYFAIAINLNHVYLLYLDGLNALFQKAFRSAVASLAQPSLQSKAVHNVLQTCYELAESAAQQRASSSASSSLSTPARSLSRPLGLASALDDKELDLDNVSTRSAASSSSAFAFHTSSASGSNHLNTNMSRNMGMNMDGDVISNGGDASSSYNYSRFRSFDDGPFGSPFASQFNPNSSFQFGSGNSSFQFGSSEDNL